MSGIPESIVLWSAKAAGATAGSAVSIAFMLPASRREAATRFAVGIVCGLVFGGMAGVKLAVYFNLLDRIGAFEMMLTGSAAASLCAWWGLGVLSRVAGQLSAGPAQHTERSEDHGR